MLPTPQTAKQSVFSRELFRRTTNCAVRTKKLEENVASKSLARQYTLLTLREQSAVFDHSNVPPRVLREKKRLFCSLTTPRHAVIKTKHGSYCLPPLLHFLIHFQPLPRHYLLLHCLLLRLQIVFHNHRPLPPLLEVLFFSHCVLVPSDGSPHKTTDLQEPVDRTENLTVKYYN